jgi:phage-related tail protein
VFSGSISCNSFESKIDSFTKDLEYAEENYADFNTEDWNNLETDYNNLVNQIDNQEDLTNEEIKKIAKIKGRYSSLILKKGVKDFQKTIENVGEQIDGFIEGLNNEK